MVGRKCDGPVKLYLYFAGEEPELLTTAESVGEAIAIVQEFKQLEQSGPTDGRLLIEVH